MGRHNESPFSVTSDGDNNNVLMLNGSFGDRSALIKTNCAKCSHCGTVHGIIGRRAKSEKHKYRQTQEKLDNGQDVRVDVDNVYRKEQNNNSDGPRVIQTKCLSHNYGGQDLKDQTSSVRHSMTKSKNEQNKATSSQVNNGVESFGPSTEERYVEVFQTNNGTSKFALGGICGVGVSSVVRRCVEKETGKEYAVKIIDISTEKQEEYQAEQTKQDTKREINILKMCFGHKHIIELHDSFETNTFIFLVFEFHYQDERETERRKQLYAKFGLNRLFRIYGEYVNKVGDYNRTSRRCKQGELFDYLTQVVTLSEKRTRIVIRQLLEAVDFIHKKNVVHRDLKPENILLDDDLNLKLSDFGFATVLGPKEELSELCGTPGYLAPEVLAVSMYDDVPGYGQPVDMWAVGVIMYTLLCGAPPFWHRKQMQMLRMIMQANYQFGSPEWDDISQAPKDLIASLLVIDPAKRLTASEALQHPFFKRDQVKPVVKFQAKKKFKAAVICVNFFYRMRFFKNNPPPISGEVINKNPYSVKNVRKLIDGCAFKMYGHWVKKVDNQNRAALFEHAPRADWKEDQHDS